MTTVRFTGRRVWHLFENRWDNGLRCGRRITKAKIGGLSIVRQPTCKVCAR